MCLKIYLGLYSKSAKCSPKIQILSRILFYPLPKFCFLKAFSTKTGVAATFISDINQPLAFAILIFDDKSQLLQTRPQQPKKLSGSLPALC
ncbi:MAG: hypothetical protein EAZ57_08045 [Cytophagales bacterium]|nr:MAG: hypothetical protein EAZ67_09125 [Cytophagales bacterium]TAF60284.1 MAG: hypothetical protein EAZ57_08045 [Cytophagales bacterium]